MWNVPNVLSDVSKNDYIILKMIIYDLDELAMQYYKKAFQIQEKLGFVGGYVNLCLYVKKSEKGIVYIALHIDNNLLVNVEVIDEAIAALKKIDWS